MSYGITRELALALLKQHVKGENMLRHCLSRKGETAALAGRLGAEELGL